MKKILYFAGGAAVIWFLFLRKKSAAPVASGAAGFNNELE